MHLYSAHGCRNPYKSGGDSIFTRQVFSYSVNWELFITCMLFWRVERHTLLRVAALFYCCDLVLTYFLLFVNLKNASFYNPKTFLRRSQHIANSFAMASMSSSSIMSLWMLHIATWFKRFWVIVDLNQDQHTLTCPDQHTLTLTWPTYTNTDLTYIH